MSTMEETDEDAITSQIQEIELLSSIYTEDEFFIKPDILSLLYEVKRGESNLLPDVFYEIKIEFESIKLEVSVDIPGSYPLDQKPDIYVRSASFTRETQKQFNDDLAEYITSLEKGGVCVYDAVLWVQDKVESLFKKDAKPKSKKKPKPKLPTKETKMETFTRLWVHSHHIYSKNKRRDIVNLAVNRNLTGFSMFGKPGIICAEGSQSDVNSWWVEVRGLEWQKIDVRRTDVEMVPLATWDDAVLDLRRFSDFREISFGKPLSSHNNMSEFKEFLKSHNCEDVFNQLFKL